MSTRTHATRAASTKPAFAPPSKMIARSPAPNRAGTAIGGQALDNHSQREMSARFGHDFRHVRIHQDNRAAEAAEAVGASAFAVGSDIVFGEGRYKPGTRETDRLLAHELTHVVQQDRYGAATSNIRSRRSDSSEREAENVADQVVMGKSVDVRSTPNAAISCFDPAYNDVQNDFWGTKSMLGNKWGNVADSAMNIFWDAVGFLPGGSAVSAGVDAAKSGYSEGMSTLEGWEAGLTGNNADRMRSQQYHEAAGSFAGDMAVDATGMIPIYGTGQSALGTLWDGARTIDLATGADPNGSPSFTDIQKQGGSSIWNGITGGSSPAPTPSSDPDPNIPPPNMPSDPFQGLQ